MENTGKDAVTNVNEARVRRLMSLMVFSIFMLWTFALTVFVNIHDAHYFSYAWTQRDLLEPAKYSVAKMYADNRNTSAVHLGYMLDTSFEAAGCKSVIYGSDDLFHWEEEDASPTCNCLRNVHAEYVKAVTPNGYPLTVQVMSSPSGVTNSSWVASKIRSECFQNVRHSQVEQMFERVSSFLLFMRQI